MQGLPPHTSTLEDQQSNVLTDIGGFILRRKANSFCQSCEQLCVASDDSQAHQLINLKSYGSNQALLKPSTDMISLLKSTEDGFNLYVDYFVRQKQLEVSLFQRLIASTSYCNIQHCQRRHATHTILRLYMNVRRHHALKIILADSAVKRPSKKHVKLAS